VKAIFVPGCVQSDIHHLVEPKGRRLAKFLNLLGECGIEASFPSPEKLETQIVGADLIIATTRRSNLSESDLAILVDAVKTGRSLLHLSNHRPYSSYDCSLAERLGYKFTDRCFVDKNKRMPFDHFEFVIDLGKLPNYEKGFNHSKKVSITNCSSIDVQDKRFNILSVLPETCIFARDGSAGGGEVFAIACEKSDISGRIIAMGDSGLIGEPSSEHPGPGLGSGDNYAILRCITEWLVS